MLRLSAPEVAFDHNFGESSSGLKARQIRRVLRGPKGPLFHRKIHLGVDSRIVFPSAAERRAASRISVTVTLVSRDDRASGLAPSRITARRYERELSYGEGRALAASCSSCVLSPPRRTRMSLL